MTDRAEAALEYLMAEKGLDYCDYHKVWYKESLDRLNNHEQCGS